MKDILDARQEFKAFFILLQQDNWFNKICSTHELSKMFDTASKGSESWEYALRRFVFKNISLDRHIRPEIVSEITKNQAYESRLIFEIICNCKSDLRPEVIEDPILRLGAHFIIQFEYVDQATDSLKVLQCFWHLDKHDVTKQSATAHPLYHYEFGGGSMAKAKEFDFGDFICRS